MEIKVPLMPMAKCIKSFDSGNGSLITNVTEFEDKMFCGGSSDKKLG